MAVNKVIYGGNTLVDLTGDTVTAADLADGVKATGADGNPIVGLMQKVTIDAELSTTSTNPVQNKAIYNALLGKVGNEDIFNGFALRSPTASIMWRIGTQTLGSLTASNYTGTSLRATQDSDGNIINTTYAKKSDISGMVKSVNNIKPDNNGNVTIAGGGGSGGSVIVDDALSDTSTNPVQNKVVKAALDNRAVLDDVNTFTSPNNFDDIYMEDGINSLKWYNGSPNFVVASINSKKYTGEAATARKATQDGAGNVITDTYTKKADFDKTISELGVAFQQKADKSDLADVATSGKYTDLLNRPDYVVQSVNNVKPDSNGNVSISVSGGGGGGSNITVDTELSATSTNPVQNKVIYNALLNKVGTDIFSGFALMGATSTIAWRQGSQAIGSINATNYTGTAARATQDGAGNVITETYAKKADISGVVKSVNGTKPDTDGNVVIDVSGGGGGSGAYLPLTGGTVTGGITAPNFQTGTGAANYFQCRKFRGEGNADSYYHAIDFGYSGHDSVDFYEYDPNWNFYKCLTGTKSGAVLVGNINGNGWNGGARLSGTPTAPTAVAGTNTTQIATTAFVQSAIPTNVSSFTNDAGYIKSVNNTKPDSNGNVTITVSGGGGVSTSESNTWTGKQTFQKMKFNFESYNAPRISGATDNPSSSVAVYNVQGNFTLDMSTLAGLLSNGDATVFTAYITANGSYTLSITNAGTLKYAGSATDLAITANGLLLNIMLIKSSSGVLSSVAQASTLS